MTTDDQARYEPARTSDGAVDLTAASWDPASRQPKGDHNRRLALFLEPGAFAAEAGITEEQLRDYERTPPDGKFDIDVARRVGEALERLEQNTPVSDRVVS
jgi:hypothetical protein